MIFRSVQEKNCFTTESMAAVIFGR